MDELPELLDALARFPDATLPDGPLGEPCLERLRSALADLRQHGTGRVGAGDLAGLVGHVVWRCAAAGWAHPVRVPDTPPWPTAIRWRAAGLRVASQAGGTLLVAPGEPWTPYWLAGAGAPREPLAVVFAETKRRHLDDSPQLAADPCWPATLGAGFARFTSPGQREALRAAALAPPGSSLVVNLPTGAGKSLVGWGPALLGLPDRGVTLVVVPTVALGFDQERQVRRLLEANRLAGPAAPLAWHGGLPEDERLAIRQAIRAGRQVVVFASPEAATTALAPALFDAAEAGLLRGFVVDEAHTVAQWGNEFRPDFQAIAGLRKELLRRAPRRGQFRTRLLSATLTQESFDTLDQLFGPVQTVSAVHLRPEPSFWVAQAADQREQDQWVRETVQRVPRPFLLYVSTRQRAEDWAKKLREEEKILRVDYVHGGSGDREGVVDRWRHNRLDAVVATSAFGLGMDKADVRAVIHACVPETTDRFYQEVGRGGRDGRASLSLVVYTDADLDVAARLNQERVISASRGLERWETMLAQSEAVQGRDSVLRLDLTARPEDISADSDANLAWNLRTLLLMARAGLVELESEPPPALEPAPNELPAAFDARAHTSFDRYFSRALITPKPGHRCVEVWKTRIEDERRRTGGANRDQLARIRQLLTGGREFGEAFAELYALDATGEEVRPEPVCGGCPGCRADGADRTWYMPPAPPPPAGRDFPVDPRLRAALRFSEGEALAVVTYPRPGPSPRSQRRWRDLVLRELFPRLAGLGVREFAVGPRWKGTELYSGLSRYAPERYVVHAPLEEESEPAWPLPRASLLDPSDPPDVVPRWQVLLHRPLHVLLVPADARDPDRPDDLYADRHRSLPVSAVLDELTR
jgi:ATP-dependent DNA helicase RecQ